MGKNTILKALNKALEESNSIRNREIYAEAIEDYCYRQVIIETDISVIKALAIDLSSYRAIGTGTKIEKLCNNILDALK